MRANRETIKRLTPYICATWVFGTLFWLLWPILDSAYIADDIPNSQRSAGLKAANETLIDFTFRLTRQWMKNEGRFFPVSVFENALIFNTVHSRFLYKLLELLAAAVLASCLAVFVQLIARNWKVTLLTVTAFCVALQVRFWYDPTISFGLLLPSTGIKALVALCLIVAGIRSHKRGITVCTFTSASILWSLALMQYEIVLLLGSIVILIALHEVQYSYRKRLAGVLAIISPSIVFLIISRVIRSGIVASPAYATNLDIGAVSRALKYQLLGGVPLSVPMSGVDERSGVWNTVRTLSIVEILIACIAIIVMIFLLKSLEKLATRTRITIFVSGLALFILPAVPTSLSVRWQSELGPGHAYLPIMLQYLGTALLLVTATTETMYALRILRSRMGRTFEPLVLVTAFVLSILSVVTICTNRSGIVYTNYSYVGFKIDREIFEGATRLGLLSNSLTDGVLLSATHDPALWVNREYVSWLGGPLIRSFGRPQEMISCRVSGAQECQMSNGGLYIIEHNDFGEVTAAFVTVKDWWKSPTTTKDVKSVSAISKQRENLLCGSEDARKISGWWLSDCSLIDEIMFQKIKAQYAS
jgi:hypothetical protein